MDSSWLAICRGAPRPVRAEERSAARATCRSSGLLLEVSRLRRAFFSPSLRADYLAFLGGYVATLGGLLWWWVG